MTESQVETAPLAGPERPPQDLPVAFSDPVYLAAVVDLLGAIAYGEMSAFERLSEDAKMAPELRDKVELARMASTEFGHFEGLCSRLSGLGTDPFEAMAPFVAAFESFHARTAPADWLEGLVKAYVGDGLAADFYR
jgi:1,2-phenylacetyl-CoA epoxidase catalytic subunit